ncbi:DUF885 domain-containing protein [Blastomonas aquatica]|uniref:DUF885 domain-containing protein n=1 Tax=Blastomonas aquatica TaxID=1510276 RepID=A0ABQ1J163_9SPHN|nr:DUF885 domain-containing protein [Blastomonas aquatica]GGB57416.1 hypothetical protein GCM10010833_10180 [Blastomonas aquatica]
MNWSKKLLAAVSLGVLVTACGMPPAEPVDRTEKATGIDTASDWGKFVDSFLTGYFARNPDFAVYQGRHEFDGKLPDWSEQGLADHTAFLEKTLADAQAIDAATLDAEQRFERDYLMAVARGKLFWLKQADWPHRNPAFYTGTLDPSVYVTRPYADVDTRAKAFIAYARGVPKAAEQIRSNLRTPLDPYAIDYGVNAFGGYASFFIGDARAAFADVSDAGIKADLESATAEASEAMQGLADWLRTEKPNAKVGYALGPELFSQMLVSTEMVDLPMAELKAIGEADLKRNQQALTTACAQFAPGSTMPECMAKLSLDKPEDGPVAEARRQLPELRAFLVDKDLVSIPGTEEAKVEESPPYNRQNSAYIDIPGPYEKGLPSIYYISPPDPSWAPEVQAEYIPPKKDLMFTSVHEVWPGHFLNFLHANRAKSFFGRLFVGYAYAEGWAHYTEEMMWEAGLGKGDPEVHIGQLANALLRNCRYLSAIGLHTGGMSVDQSLAMFREQCFIDEGNARQQALRGTYDPGYLNYTLGKLMIRKLRADWTADKGGRDAWKAFHDAFLTYGGPPVPMVRAAMMEEGTPKAVF